MARLKNVQVQPKASVQVVDVTGGQHVHAGRLTIYAAPGDVLSALRALCEAKGWTLGVKKGTGHLGGGKKEG